MVKAGDIVLLDSLRYVVDRIVPKQNGGQDAKLIRRTKWGSFSSIESNPSRLTRLETPSFESGEKVTVDGIKGTYLSRERDGNIARVMLAPRRRQFTAVGFFEIGPAVARVSFALLVIENRNAA
ncbi:hypothetical protein [Mesorhizobium sp. B2-4-17]|uniref:hypothetical protein n=1 Tax=Mesorhizobium sp. B2-4-17 TaxID=2589932 RepID=UPI00112670FA|nr:hypothetical protein [Mesorhizobium sp. B2-4-17]TPK69899.1 hypothetical protein FJ548_29665 [Mesorhizobium sp. B2-4-17]